MSRQKKSECIAQQGILSVNVHIADPTGITVLTATELGSCLFDLQSENATSPWSGGTEQVVLRRTFGICLPKVVVSTCSRTLTNAAINGHDPLQQFTSICSSTQVDWTADDQQNQ